MPRKELRVAKVVASKTGASLAILHAYRPNIDDTSISVTKDAVVLGQELENSAKHQLSAYVAQARVEGFMAEGIWKCDRTHAAILRQAVTTKAGLVVMG